MRLLCLTALLAALATADAQAGLRPRYGGEIIVMTPIAPVELDPARAWSAVEVALASSIGAPISAFLDAPPELLAPNTVRLKLSPNARWPDGRPADGPSVAQALQAAVARSRVALPTLKLEVEKNALVVTALTDVLSVREILDLPWLHLVSEGRGGAFRLRRGLIEADASACGGAAFADALRIELYENRMTAPPDAGIILGRPGLGGRPVVAVPRGAGDVRQALDAALSTLDRASLVRLFVRATAQPSTQPRSPETPPAERPNAPVLLALDASERTLRPVAQRLQVLLRDAGLFVRIIAEARDAHFARLASRDYDLALVALPTAPDEVLAATVFRLFGEPGAGEAFWQSTGVDLTSALKAVDATHLYTEGGGVEVGTRLRGATTTAPWSVDLSNAWLSIESGRP